MRICARVRDLKSERLRLRHGPLGGAMVICANRADKTRADKTPRGCGGMVDAVDLKSIDR